MKKLAAIKLKYLKLAVIAALGFNLVHLSASGAEPKKKEFTLVVDAGHGGKDLGASENKAREKDINLGVALELRNLLQKNHKDINVVMTRDDDTYLTLQQRADVANKSKGDLFISIHTNSVDKSNRNRKNISGASVYALGLHKDDNNMLVARRENSVIELEQNYEQKYSGFDPSKDESYIIFEMAQKKNLSKSIKFAEEAQKRLVESGRKSRGVHQAGFWVLWATSMPSVLIELDFICNPASAEYLSSEKGNKELAEAIYKAVVSYKDSWEKSNAAAAASREKIPEVKENEVVSVREKGESRRVVKAPASSNSQDVRRKRRSDSSKKISDTRNLEVDAIALHKESERSGQTELQEEEEIVAVAAPVVNDDPDPKGKKSKKEKKAKKSQNNTTRKRDAHNARIEKFVTIYKIQVLASAELLKQDSPRFCGLNPITTYKENNLYKYYYGESENRGEIDGMLKEVKKLIPDAFVVSSMKSVDKSKQ